MGMDADGEEAERAGALRGDEIRERTAGGFLLPEHREPAGAQVDGFAVAPGREEAGGEADGDAAGADHPVQHGASFVRELRVLLHAPDSAEHCPVEKGDKLLERQFGERDIGG